VINAHEKDSIYNDIHFVVSTGRYSVMDRSARKHPFMVRAFDALTDAVEFRGRYVNRIKNGTNEKAQ